MSLSRWSVVFRGDEKAQEDPPEVFVCSAADSEHAEEQCLNAYPACEILWTYQGEGDAALADYMDNCLLRRIWDASC